MLKERLSSLLAETIREYTHEQAPIDPDRIAEKVISRLWADLQRDFHETDADWVKSIRIQEGLTQTALAQVLGTSQVTVARWESSTRKVSKKYRQLLQALVARGEAASLQSMATTLTPSPVPQCRPTTRPPALERRAKSMDVTFDMQLFRQYEYPWGSKKEARRAVEEELREFSMVKPDPKQDEYLLTIPYDTEEDLDKTVHELLRAVYRAANLYDCDAEVEVTSQDEARELAWP